MSIPKIFISYAREDITFKEELVTIIGPMERDGLIESWHDGLIQVGTSWDEAIKTNLHSADIVICLLSRRFIASEYIYREEMPPVFERVKQGTAKIIPIVVRSINLGATHFGKYQCLPQDNLGRLKAINEWQPVDPAWAQIDAKIRTVVNSFGGGVDPVLPKKEPPAPSIAPPSPVIVPPTGQKDLGQTKRALKKALVRDVGTALDKLEAILSEDSSFSNTLTQLQSQYNQYKRDSRMGIVSHENATIRQNRLVYAFQSLVDDLEEEDLV